MNPKKNRQEKYSLKDVEYFKVVKDDDMEKERKMIDKGRIQTLIA